MPKRIKSLIKRNRTKCNLFKKDTHLSHYKREFKNIKNNFIPVIMDIFIMLQSLYKARVDYIYKELLYCSRNSTLHKKYSSRLNNSLLSNITLQQESLNILYKKSINLFK